MKFQSKYMENRNFKKNNKKKTNKLWVKNSLIIKKESDKMNKEITKLLYNYKSYIYILNLCSLTDKPTDITK